MSAQFATRQDVINHQLSMVETFRVMLLERAEAIHEASNYMIPDTLRVSFARDMGVGYLEAGLDIENMIWKVDVSSTLDAQDTTYQTSVDMTDSEKCLVIAIQEVEQIARDMGVRNWRSRK